MKRANSFALAPVMVLALLFGAALGGCQSSPAPDAAKTTQSAPSAPRPPAPPPPAVTLAPKIAESAPVPAPPPPQKPEDQAREAFRGEARTLANLAIAHEYRTFNERWGTLAAAAARAGIGRNRRDDEELAYSTLSYVKAMMETRDEVDANLKRTRYVPFVPLLEDIQRGIDRGANEALEMLGD